MCEKISRNGIYPLGDWFPSCKDNAMLNNHLRAKWNGEFRPLKKNEWYLSGAIITAYKAYQDYSIPYFIADIFQVEMVTTVRLLRKMCI
jgi:hypothetical protein